jgi:putative peptide zinc metalloprotease protein
MNLTRVLNVALPDMPARVLSERPPRLDPGIIAREHLEGGKTVIRTYVPCAKIMFTFPPPNWGLAQLFDGSRSYEEIAELYSQQTGAQYSAEEVREFASNLDAIDFWYRTPQEKNILLMQQSAEERRKKLKQQNRWGDLAEVLFPAFNPDPFLTKLYSYTKFVYSGWFTTLTLTLFAVAAGITITHWSEVGRDTVAFYNFSNRTLGDILVFYVLVLGVVVVHEFAHAYASKHFGGRVTAMGFALIYLTPAFYTDTTEAEVTATRDQRLIVTIAGVWSELVICSMATIIWWGTAPDTAFHNSAYFLMMLTGIMSVLLNWNPLMKLDGYYILCDLVRIPDLKEASTAYVCAWVKRYIWRLPVEVPYVPKSRRLGYAVYAILSGAYSYTVLYVVARFAGNVVRNFSPEWGFIPEIAVALLIFRSRIRSLVNLMKFFYLDKKERIIAWFTPRHSIAVAAALVILLALPLWHESATGRFLLEPAHLAVVRARVPGVITQLDAEEGQRVARGETLATLRNLPLESDFEDTKTNLLLAGDRAKAASLHYSDFGQALKEREGLAGQFQQISAMDSALEVTSPIEGTVVTPRVGEFLGSYLKEGQELLEVADLSSLRARIYISEYDLYKVRQSTNGRLMVQGLFKTWPAQIVSIAARPTEIDERLTGKVELRGMNPPHFYIVDLVVQNIDGTLKPGMAGVARIYGQRSSLFGLAWETFSNFWGRKLW